MGWALDTLDALGQDSADSEILTSLLFTLYLSIFSTITSLPFTIYSTFVVEENHGFNKQTAGFFAVDQVKKFVVSQAIQAPILAGVIKIVVLITLFLMTIYPDLI